MMPKMPNGSFAKKLFSLYLTYLPKEKFAYPLKMNVDDRGSFTELVHMQDCGQVSINISKPGITKGQHWHNSKWELFIVVAGHGLIQERNINTGEMVEFEVSGEKIEAVYMIPGWTHNIINLSETENLVTVMTCNEVFDRGATGYVWGSGLSRTYAFIMEQCAKCQIYHLIINGFSHIIRSVNS